MKRRSKVFLVGMLAVFSLETASSALPAETYTFGVVPQFEQRQLLTTWKPLLEELQRRTGLSFRLAGVPTIPAFEVEFIKGSYDFVYMNPYHFLKANTSQGYVPIVRDGAPLQGILVVRRDSGIQSPAELDGRTVAFPAPNALGASLLMRADLARVHQVDVAPLYVKTHNSVYLHVIKGLAEAGGGVGKTLTEQEQPIRDSLRILYVTRDMPSHPVAVHPRVPKADAEKVRAALLALAAEPEGAALLARIPMKRPFAAAMDDYEVMRGWGLDDFWVED
jgi:phosphonate transport system substrate-binding protein